MDLKLTEKAVMLQLLSPRVFCRRVVLLVTLVGVGCTDLPKEATTQSAAKTSDLGAELESILGESPSKSSTNFEVFEVLEAGRYSYVRLKDGSGDRWVAAPKVTVAVGDRVTVGNAALMENFTSPSLKRTFEQIHFANEIKVVGDKPVAIPEKTDPASPAQTPVEPADGGLTIEKVMSDPAGVGSEPVRVRGRVVKFNAQIMGRNWIHIQDGSGNAKAGSHDLTITTDATVRVGQTIEAVGKLVQNKDFGAGYNYPVLLEEATIKVLP